MALLYNELHLRYVRPDPRIQFSSLLAWTAQSILRTLAINRCIVSCFKTNILLRVKLTGWVAGENWFTRNVLSIFTLMTLNCRLPVKVRLE